MHEPTEPDAQQEGDSSPPTFVVGIGASAGGLEALERFFQAMPIDSGLAFVVIQHLSPDFHSVMDELLAMLSGQLHALDKADDQRLSMPINRFFRSLAREVGDRAIAIVLSGTGTDGSLGLGEVHEAPRRH